jgi:hypothetical protein
MRCCISAGGISGADACGGCARYSRISSSFRGPNRETPPEETADVGAPRNASEAWSSVSNAVRPLSDWRLRMLTEMSGRRAAVADDSARSKSWSRFPTNAVTKAGPSTFSRTVIMRCCISAVGISGADTCGARARSIRGAGSRRCASGALERGRSLSKLSSHSSMPDDLGDRGGEFSGESVWPAGAGSRAVSFSYCRQLSECNGLCRWLNRMRFSLVSVVDK